MYVYFICHLRFKMYVLKTNRSIKNIPGLKPQYHKNLTCRQARNNKMEKNHRIAQPDILLESAFLFFPFWGKIEPELWKGVSLSSG